MRGFGAWRNRFVQSHVIIRQLFRFAAALAEQLFDWQFDMHVHVVCTYVVTAEIDKLSTLPVVAQNHRHVMKMRWGFRNAPIWRSSVRRFLECSAIKFSPNKFIFQWDPKQTWHMLFSIQHKCWGVYYLYFILPAAVFFIKLVNQAINQSVVSKSF